MFLLSNYRSAGLKDEGFALQGTYVAHCSGDDINAVVAQFSSGNIIVQAPSFCAELALEVSKATQRPIAAVLGPSSQVTTALAGLGLSAADASFASHEVLFALDLSNLQVPEPLIDGRVRCARAESHQLDLLAQWRWHYSIEALDERPDSERLAGHRAAMKAGILDRRFFVLTDEEDNRGESPPCVAMCAFNARIPECVQMGSVWTPLALRSRGYARAVVAGALLTARREGAVRSVLFTGERNVSAQKAYLSLGYQPIGDYAIVLFGPARQPRQTMVPTPPHAVGCTSPSTQSNQEEGTSMKNPVQTLGASTLRVGRIGLGCMGMSEFYGGVRDDAAHIKTLHAAVDLGIQHFDTADMYGVGHNESLIGQAFKDRWSQVTVATKFGVRRGPKGEWLGISGRPEYVREACDASLKRLGVETIDLYYQHRPDPSVPVEESIGAMKRLVEEGKVRFIGVSEFTAEQIRAAHAVHPITALQTEYSLWTRHVESEDILKTCRELGIAFVAYSPLGRGFLTGAIASPEALDANDWRRSNPRFGEDAWTENARFLDLLRGIAAEKHVAPAQVALAWVLAQGDDIFTIPGTRRIERLKENLGAAEVVFTEDELREIRSRLPDKTAGARY